MVTIFNIIKNQSKIELNEIIDLNGTSYSITGPARDLSRHTDLIKLSAISNTVESLKAIQKETGKRNVRITLSATLKSKYYDEDDNLRIGDSYFEESFRESSFNDESSQNTDLMDQIRDLQLQLASKDLERNIKVENFNGKQDATDWFNDFESELKKYHIDKLDTKLRILKSSLDSNVIDWYCTNVKILKDKPFEDWRNSFIDIFGKKSWSNSRKAIEFRYLSGSLVEYGLRKRRMLIDDDPRISDSTVSRLIVCGLPNYIEKLIDFDKATSSEMLLAEFGKLSSIHERKSFNIRDSKPKNEVNRNPCENCLELFNKKRMHPESACFFKDDTRLRKNFKKDDKPKRVNVTSLDQVENDLNKIQLNDLN